VLALANEPCATTSQITLALEVSGDCFLVGVDFGRHVLDADTVDAMALVGLSETFAFEHMACDCMYVCLYACEMNRYVVVRMRQQIHRLINSTSALATRGLARVARYSETLLPRYEWHPTSSGFITSLSSI
jgi:hypothetical protein